MVAFLTAKVQGLSLFFSIYHRMPNEISNRAENVLQEKSKTLQLYL